VTTTGYRGHFRRAVPLEHVRAALTRAGQPGAGNPRM
jgi:hypothetical protein